jgi:hypothetical protein
MLTTNGYITLGAVGLGLLSLSLVRSCNKQKTLVETYEQQLTELRQTIAMQERQLSERTDEQTIVREDITEQRVDGTIRRIKRERESTSVKKIEVSEKATQATTETKESAVVATKTEVTVPASSSLGLDLGVGLRFPLYPQVDRDTWHEPVWQFDVSYELAYGIAPRVGVEFPLAFSNMPSAVYVGVEVRL